MGLPSYSAHVGSLFSMRLLAMLANAASYVYMARFLGPFQFGVAASAIGVVMLLQVVVDLGGGSLAARDASESSSFENLGSALRYRRYLSDGWLGISVVALIVSVVGHWNLSLLVLYGLWILAGVYESLFVGLLIGLGRTFVGATVSLIERLTALGIILGMPFFLDPDVTDFVAAFATGAVVAGVVGGALVWHECKVALSYAPKLSTKSLRRGVSFMTGSLGANLQNLDVPLVAWVAGAASAGLLAAPSRITTPLGVLAASAATIVLVQKRHIQGQLPLLPTAFPVVALTAVGVSPLIFAPGVVSRFVIGEAYEGADGVFRLVALGVILASFNQVLAADLQAHHEQRRVALTVIAGGILGLLVVGLTAPALGAVGGGLGVVSAQVLIVGLLTTYRRRMLRGAVAQ